MGTETPYIRIFKLLSGFFFFIRCYASELLQTPSLMGPNSFWCAVGFNKEANTFTPKLFVRKTEGREVEGDDMEWGLGA